MISAPPTLRRVSWVKMLRRLTCDGDYLMIDVIRATPAAQCRRADITLGSTAHWAWQGSVWDGDRELTNPIAGLTVRHICTMKTRNKYVTGSTQEFALFFFFLSLFRGVHGALSESQRVNVRWVSLMTPSLLVIYPIQNSHQLECCAHVVIKHVSQCHGHAQRQTVVS